MRSNCQRFFRRAALILVAGTMLATASGAAPVAAESEPLTADTSAIEAVPGHDHSTHVHSDAAELPEPPSLPGLEPQTAAAGAPQPTFGANRTQPVVMVNGYLGPQELSDGKNVNGEFANVINALGSWGWSGQVGGAAIYECDSNWTWNTESHGKPGVTDKHNYALGGRSRAVNHEGDGCGAFSANPKTTSHTRETSIEHLAYHWAWMLRDTFGTQCVNAVGHSMGALVIRYAIARIGNPADPDFPHDVCIDDVVSLGGAHGGSSNADFCPTYQCLQQRSGSNFLTWLSQNARNPQGAGGTDWTNFGSTGDGSTPPPGSTNANMDPAHSVVYEENIAHTDSNPFDTLYWKNATSGDITANIRWKDAAIGAEATTQDGPWPIRHADMSMAYNQWGCGVGNTTSAFPLKNGLLTVGEPYTTSFDCWYYIDVDPSARHLTVRMSSLNSRDMDLYLYPGSPTASPGCVAASSLSTETCSVTNAASGRWYVRVRNFAGTRDPFTVQATFQNDCATGVDAGSSHALASSMTPVSSCSGFLVPPDLDAEDWFKFPVVSGQRIDVTLRSNDTSNFDACIYSPSGGLVAGCTTGSVGGVDELSHLASSAGDYRLRIKATSGAGSYILTTTVKTPQNDCGTGSDAGGFHANGASITLPQSDCSGMLLPSEFDTDDHFRFQVTSGQTINASMTPNASSNYNICLYDPPGNLVVSCTGGSAGGTDTLSHVASSSGQYSVRVTRATGTGSYTLSVSASSQNDCGIGGDAGGSHAAAASLGLPQSNCSGTLVASSDLEDWYQFLVAADQVVNISMTPNASSDYDLCLYDPSGSVVGSCSVLGTGQTESITRQVTVTGNFRMRVFRFNGTGSYTMSAWVAQNDCLIANDAGGSHAAASTLVVPKSNCTGMLDTVNGDTEDWFQFPVTAGQTITASMTPNASSNFDFCLYHPNGSLVGSCSTLGTGQTDSLTHQAAATGNYRLRVFRVSGSGVYTMSVSKSGGPTIIRRDDNERDTSSPYNYSDDLAVKRLPVTSGELSGKTTAKLWVLAQAEACSGAPPDNKFRFDVNGTDSVAFNPCNEWSTTSFTWKSFTIPINLIPAGTVSFKIEHVSGDWTTRDMQLAVDTDTVPDDSDIAFDNNHINGELMWYLELT